MHWPLGFVDWAAKYTMLSAKTGYCVVRTRALFNFNPRLQGVDLIHAVLLRVEFPFVPDPCLSEAHISRKFGGSERIFHD